MPSFAEPVRPPAQLKSEGATPALTRRPVAEASPAAAAPLPARLRYGAEALGGFSLADVRVHRNSPEPARLGALAFARGGDIYLGPGEERHLPHETWHVVQQRQGRVATTLSVGGVGCNDDPALETEADRMGRNSQTAAAPATFRADHGGEISKVGQGSSTIQRQAGHDSEADEPPDLADDLSLNRKVEGIWSIPTPGLTTTMTMTGTTAIEHKGLKAVAESLTKAAIKRNGTEVASKLGVSAKELIQLWKGLWSQGDYVDILRPDRASASISSEVGSYNFETKVTPLPLSISTTIKPKQDLVIDLGGGFQSTTSVTFEVKLTQQDRGPTSEPQPKLDPAPQTYQITPVSSGAATRPPEWFWVVIGAIGAIGTFLIANWYYGLLLL